MTFIDENDIKTSVYIYNQGEANFKKSISSVPGSKIIVNGTVCGAEGAYIHGSVILSQTGKTCGQVWAQGGGGYLL